MLVDINPVKDGRDANGCAVAVLSTQRSSGSVGFGKPGKADARSLAKAGSEGEPGPGQCESVFHNPSLDLPCKILSSPVKLSIQLLS